MLKHHNWLGFVNILLSVSNKRKHAYISDVITGQKSNLSEKNYFIIITAIK
jgi:hypothetical protein